MSKIINGREWKWWIVYNDHSCLFCHNNNVSMSLGHLTGTNMCDGKYWGKLYHVFMKHLKEYHPDIR